MLKNQNLEIESNKKFLCLGLVVRWRMLEKSKIGI
jgi:hypothetical protein